MTKEEIEEFRKVLPDLLSKSLSIGNDSKVKRDFKGKSIRKKLDRYTVIDLETTGKYVNTCEVIEMSALKIKNGKIIDTFSTFVKPKGAIPKEIILLTGITPDMLENSPSIDKIIEDYVKFIGDDIILGHNITSYDSNIIYDAYYLYCDEYFTNDMLDTYHYARCCDIDVPNYKLTTLAKYFNIENNDAHRALNDCIVNFKCYEMLKQHFDNNYRTQKAESSGNKNNISCLRFPYELADNIDIDTKQICLTGEFNYASKSDVTKYLESIGAIIKKDISSKIDYLIVGGKGNVKWKNGNYGSKIEKALKLQDNGKKIKIINEKEILKCKD